MRLVSALGVTFFPFDCVLGALNTGIISTVMTADDMADHPATAAAADVHFNCAANIVAFAGCTICRYWNVAA